MTTLCTLLKSGSDVLVQTFTVLVYKPSFLGYSLSTLKYYRHPSFLIVMANRRDMRQRVIALIEAGYGARSAGRLVGVPGSTAASIVHGWLSCWKSNVPSGKTFSGGGKEYIFQNVLGNCTLDKNGAEVSRTSYCRPKRRKLIDEHFQDREGNSSTAPWHRGLRHPASDSRYGMRAGSSPHGRRNFLMKFRPVYGTGAHPASSCICGATIGSENSVLETSYNGKEGNIVLTTRYRHSDWMIVHLCFGMWTTSASSSNSSNSSTSASTETAAPALAVLMVATAATTE
ncbi:hypothetical protein ANN_24391 [Periplaneta americana]|uniref:Uncharacterized protein n=1 Tax=Periplaneta americana TaxID=6978 RepID=A0ABQ8S3A7_PERAM|nr:hypothetical protein ANN_24391 [Periplaneta americana]